MNDFKEDNYIPLILYIDYINVEYNKYLNNKFKGITPRDFSYLINIYYHPNSSQRELADILIVTQANAGQIIRRLEKNNLISREIDENNKSRRVINLTSKGKSFVLKLLKASHDWEDKFFEQYSIDDEKKIKEMPSYYYLKTVHENK